MICAWSVLQLDILGSAIDACRLRLLMYVNIPYRNWQSCMRIICRYIANLTHRKSVYVKHGVNESSFFLYVSMLLVESLFWWCLQFVKPVCISCAFTNSPWACYACLTYEIDDERKLDTCVDCANSPHPWQCVHCLTQSFDEKIKRSGCLKCAGTSMMPECTSCLAAIIDADSKVDLCSTCIDTRHPEKCIDCLTFSISEDLKSTCLRCAQTADPDKCMTCLTMDSMSIEERLAICPLL